MQSIQEQPFSEPINPPLTSAGTLGLEIESTRWGWFPFLTLLDSLALVLIASAYSLQRANNDYGAVLFWISLLIIFVPTAFRLLSSSIARRERIGLVVILGLAFFMVKILHSPVDFTFYDEFLHWNTANHIAQTGRLFTDNTISPVSALYPGLEIAANAFANLAGVSLVNAGIIILGLGRIALMLGLYLFFERVSSSPQIGGIAALLYTANSNFIFFDSQFSYESLSLPIGLTILFWVAYTNRKPVRNFVQHTLLLVPLVAAMTITHHLTSYVVVAILVVWAIVAFFKNRKSGDWQHLGSIALITFIIVYGWSKYVGNTTNEYLEPVFRNGVNEFSSLILDENQGRELFRSSNGQVSPVWERVVGIGAVVFILGVLPFGLFEILRSPFQRSFLGKRITRLRYGLLQSWQRYRNNALAFTLGLIVLLYPIMQGFRLTSSGWEISNRSSEFLFWAMAFILAIGFFSLKAFPVLRPVWKLAFIIWAGVVFVGGVISGSPPWARLPGSYLVAADTRSIEPEGISAARWAGDYLEPNSRISADRINTLLLAVYGNLRPVTHLADGVYLSSVYTAPAIGEDEKGLMDRVNLKYLLVDKRLSTTLPWLGVYFEAGEPNDNAYTEPIPLSALEKFSQTADVDQIFDDGNIAIYDVSKLHANS